MPGTFSHWEYSVSDLMEHTLRWTKEDSKINRRQVNMQYDRERFLLPRNWKQGKRHRVLLLDIRNSGKTSLRRLHLGRLEQALKILESVAMREQIGPRPWGRTVCGCWKLTRKLAWLERAEQAGDCGRHGQRAWAEPRP